MMVGLQGSGKTTTAGKLAKNFKKDGRRVMLVPADTRRPAAIQQLKTLAKQVGVDALRIGPAGPGRHLPGRGKAGGLVVIRGRDPRHGRPAPDRRAAHGRAPADQGRGEAARGPVRGRRHDRPGRGEHRPSSTPTSGFDGVILTKLDGDARGGAALSVKAVTGKPIKFVGMGEKLDALEPFHPDRMASRILGMGDVMSLIEKAQENVDQEEAPSSRRSSRRTPSTWTTSGTS